MIPVAAVILAAGAGRRLGGVCKALLTTADGTSFLESISSVADAAGVTDKVVVIAEPHAAETRAEAERLGLVCTVNADPSRGMASSIETGFGYASNEFSRAHAALLWPVDHARVRADTVRAVLADGHPDAIRVPVFDGRGGHPTLFGRNLWPELAGCANRDQGARSVLRDNEQRIHRLAVDDAGVVRDVDTPEDRGRG